VDEPLLLELEDEVELLDVFTFFVPSSPSTNFVDSFSLCWKSLSSLSKLEPSSKNEELVSLLLPFSKKLSKSEKKSSSPPSLATSSD